MVCVVSVTLCDCAVVQQRRQHHISAEEVISISAESVIVEICIALY